MAAKVKIVSQLFSSYVNGTLPPTARPLSCAPMFSTMPGHLSWPRHEPVPHVCLKLTIGQIILVDISYHKKCQKKISDCQTLIFEIFDQKRLPEGHFLSSFALKLMPSSWCLWMNLPLASPDYKYVCTLFRLKIVLSNKSLLAARPWAVLWGPCLRQR